MAGDSQDASSGATTCKNVTVCAPGQAQQTAPTPSSDRICAPCDGVTAFQPLAGQAACRSVRRCGAGEIIAVDPTPTSDRICTPCGNGTFQANAGQRVCRDVSPPCLAGQYEEVGTAFSSHLPSYISQTGRIKSSILAT